MLVAHSSVRQDSRVQGNDTARSVFTSARNEGLEETTGTTRYITCKKSQNKAPAADPEKSATTKAEPLDRKTIKSGSEDTAPYKDDFNQ